MNELLLTDLNDVLWLDGLVASAAFGVEELQEFLQGGGVGGVTKKRALAPDLDQALILQLVQMVGERGIGDFEFTLNFGDDQAFGMGREQQLHDSEAWLGSHGGKHVGVFGDAFAGLRWRGSFRGGDDHISILLEI